MDAENLRTRAARAAFLFCLRTFPRAFRERSAAELLWMFEQRFASLNPRGIAWLVVVLRECAGLLRAGMTERRRSRILRRQRGGEIVARNTKRGLRALPGVVRQDARHALRTLRRNPGFAGMSVGLLGLGIGSSVAIFSAVNAVLIRPLPLPQPARLVALWESNRERGWDRAEVAPANLFDWQERIPEFAAIAGYADWLTGLELGGVAQPRRVQASMVTGDYFRVLGVKPLLGRGFTSAETWSNAGSTLRAGNGTPISSVVLSEPLWRSAFAADPAIVGRTIRLERKDVRVVGVMPAALRMPHAQTDLWVVPGFDASVRTQEWFRRAHSLRGIARLAPGITVERAAAKLGDVSHALQREYPVLDRGMEGGLAPLGDYLSHDARRPLLALLAAVMLLLLSASANIANLILLRGVARERELAVRGALGASRVRLLAQLFTESAVLAIAGGALGLLLGLWGTRWLSAHQPAQLQAVQPLAVDGRVLLFALCATTGSALLFGLLPALRSAAASAKDALRAAARSSASAGRVRASQTLVVSELALALLLVLGAGLLTRGLFRVLHRDPGFDADNVLSFALALPGVDYESHDRTLGFYETLLERLRRLPGVTAAGGETRAPLEGGWGSDFTAQGWGPDRFGAEVRHREITPGYLEAMHVPVLRGRAVEARDRDGAEMTVLINSALARRFFPGEDPIGQRICFDRVPEANSVWRTIVGVVGDERQQGLSQEAAPEFLAPFAQDWSRQLYLLVRTHGDPEAVLPAVRREVAALNAHLAIFDARTVEQIVAFSLARERFVLALFGLFAALSLVLAMVGVYGVAAQMAKARTQEIGVRMALGARTGQVQRMILRRGLLLALAGLGAGLLLAWPGQRLLEGLLVGVEPGDALTIAGVCALLCGTALLASWIPARRAARTDPVRALRME